MNFFKKHSTCIHKDNNCEYHFILLSSLVSKYIIKPWRLNRPVDDFRVNEIKDHLISDSAKVLPGQISAWVNEIDELEIYDGYHRYSAGILLDFDIYIYIKINKSVHNLIVKDFTDINKSVSVPFLYLESNTIVKKLVCEYIAKKFCDNYPGCQSSSRNPQPQNFNRDNVIEMISSLDIDFNIQNLGVKLWQEICGLNLEASHYIKTHKIYTPKKCIVNRFWLFYLKRDYIKTKLEESV